MAQPRTVFQMPFLLMVTMGVHAATAIWFVLAILLAPIGFNFLNYQVNGQAVQGLEFVRAVGVTHGGSRHVDVRRGRLNERSVGDGDNGRKRSSDPLVLLESVGRWKPRDCRQSYGRSLPVGRVYGWYLYRKATVKAYYRAITAQRKQASAERGVNTWR